MSTPSRSNPSNSHAERIIAWTILLLVLAGIVAFEAIRLWMALTSPNIVGSVIL